MNAMFKTLQEYECNASLLKTSFKCDCHNWCCLYQAHEHRTGRLLLGGDKHSGICTSRRFGVGASQHVKPDKQNQIGDSINRLLDKFKDLPGDLLRQAQARSLAFASLVVATDAQPGPFSRKRSHKYPTCAHEKDLETLFKEIDSDSQGFLDIHHFRKALSRLGLPCGKDYTKSIMKQYDENHDGKVEFQEFRRYVEKREKDMQKAFDKLDADTEGRHLGGIDTDTLVHVLRHAGLPAQPEDAGKMISMLDKDHDGVISYQEFCRFCCLLPSAQVSHQNILYDWVDSSDWLSNMEYRLSMKPPKASYERLIAGGVAGAVSRTCVAPFERLRTILMTESNTNIVQASKEILQADGLLGFWRGNTLTVLKTIPQAAIQFAAYDGIKDMLTAIFPRENAQLTQWEKLFSGCVAGATAILSTYPMETLRTRMALSSGKSGLLGSCRQIWEQQGVSGYYQTALEMQGLKCGLFCEMLSVGLGFWGYELGQSIFRDLNDGQSPNPQQRGFIGGISALTIMTATMPLETVLRRLQVQGHPGKPVLYKNALDCFKTLYHQEGFRAFYRGMLSSYMKVGPSIGATYALYALLVQDWGVGGIRTFTHTQDEPALASGKD